MSGDPRHFANHVAIAELGVTMTLPVASYNPETGEPIYDEAAAREHGYGIIVSAHIHAVQPLQVARQMLVDALAKVDADIAEAEDNDPDAIVEGFDVDEAIAGILDQGHPEQKPTDDPPTGQYL